MSDPGRAADPAALVSELAREARRRGHFLIARHQAVSARSVSIANGRLEEAATSSVAGLGLHLFSRDGRSAFAALDRVDPGDARARLAALGSAVREARHRRHAANREVWSLGDTSAAVLPEPRYPLGHLSLARLVRELKAMNRALLAAGPGMKVETTFTIRLEEWTIARSDGTLSRFRMPRATVANHLTLEAAGGGQTLQATAAQSAPSYEVLLDHAAREQIESRSRRAARRLARLVSAPHVAAGSYPLVIDYALAKGLAHEAVGHAAESDSYRSSCLAEKGRLRLGLAVAAATLSVIDEPVAGDHAWQPVDANGVPRLRTTIVDRGRLAGGLSDVFTARQGGVPLSGAARAEGYRSIPLPRMTNIRIEMSDPRPLPKPFDAMEPEDVRDLLAAEGLLDARPVAYLSGYRGGQVNTMRGDFVFNCGEIHLLGKDRIDTFRPAIFSGHFLSALGAVRAGFGPLHLDAIGTCGKWGQRVPSSGGSNAFLYLEPRPDVTIGGRG